VPHRNLLPLGLAVGGLLVLAALASRGHPLGGGGSGAGPAAGFFDYVLTTLVLVGAAVVVVAVIAAVTTRPDTRARPSSGRRYFTSMLAFMAMLAIAWLLVHGHFRRSGGQVRLPAAPRQSGGKSGGHGKTSGSRGAHLRWDEIALVLALLAGGGAVLAFRARGGLLALPSFGAQESVSFALDESLDDLRTEPDLRKAIIAAYARMERALAAAGLPRRASEAPVEYLERALLALDASGDAVRHLTELFEWAKFSQHEPEPSMRDEAIAALVAVRDELRAPAPAEVA
jgi:hypothetical protein